MSPKPPTTKELIFSASLGLIFGGMFVFNGLWIFSDLLGWFRIPNWAFVAALLLGAIAGFVLGWKYLRVSGAVGLFTGRSERF
jgi:hypothetical protein